MRARAGDMLLMESGNTALIMEVLGPDGHPPLVVKWLNNGTIAMIVPNQYARIVPADAHDQPEGSVPPRPGAAREP